MILRRLMEHVKSQRWTAIVIDFVIVVAGVFVATQVSNWNAAQADRARAHHNLQRIAADLGADLDDYADRLKFWSEVSAYGATALDYAGSGDAGRKSKWEILLSFFQSSQVAEFFTTSATWDEMRGAGELGLISNLKLRAALSRYYTYAGNPALSERPLYRVHVREMIPLDVQTYIWSHCYGSDQNGRQWFTDCDAPVDERRAGAIIESLVRDKTLAGELRYWMSTMNVAARIGRDRVESATALRKAVADELAKL